MLDAGYSLPDTGFRLKTNIEHRPGFASGFRLRFSNYALTRRHGKANEHPVSSIQYRASRNVNTNDIFISDSGLSGLGLIT